MKKEGSTLGARVRKQRTDRGWDAADLAEQLNKGREQAGRNYVSRLETGATASPRVEELIALARALGVSVDWLLTGAPGPGSVVVSEDVRSDLQVRMVDALRVFYTDEGCAPNAQDLRAAAKSAAQLAERELRTSDPSDDEIDVAVAAIVAVYRQAVYLARAPKTLETRERPKTVRRHG